ncbi:hypothetical protein BLNAU_13351 [Blattamonas nauphoetae]|uniref:Uncharacterized protein n=1 Tax=Blattamonas nauphoetae TaxID=2049346 RepID=A0ABQ9XJ30_9EUKA|nr:hypothetical protein BLNAU_13351 [Blattamonas nauphoetae]
MFPSNTPGVKPTSEPIRHTNQESSMSRDDIEQARIEAKRRKFQQLEQDRMKFYSGSPQEIQEVKQQRYQELKAEKDLYEHQRKQRPVDHSAPLPGTDVSTQRLDEQTQIQNQRKQQEISLREENKRLAEARAAERQREKQRDAQYVESSEQFMNTFGKSLR